MKCIRVLADYRKDHDTKYDYLVDEDVKVKDAKEWFKKTYSWLDVRDCFEIPISDAICPLRLYKVEIMEITNG